SPWKLKGREKRIEILENEHQKIKLNERKHKSNVF
ncbi:Crp/Fnr family transcriptional regulator, partial [Listeria monocytogenes]|nr:Crp/Fnr family transcriptional regulator [Listeria monocytogenes]HEM2328345.1 Crp/Fnr family transcriptional regulator [Listeria monocytogenes]